MAAFSLQSYFPVFKLSFSHLFICIPRDFSLQKFHACDRWYVLNRLRSVYCLILYCIAYLACAFINFKKKFAVHLAMCFHALLFIFTTPLWASRGFL